VKISPDKMAKFSIFFKDKPIQSLLFESGVIHIGREDTNNLVIESLAVAPAHAAVKINESKSVIKQLNSDFPLIINGKQQKESYLKNGDTITIGKHRIIYNSTEAILSTPAQNSGNKALNQELSNNKHLPEANFQVMSGKHIGRLVPIKKTMTRLGRSGSGIIIITHKKGGYYVSMLEADEHIKVNNTPLADKILLLKNNDVLLVDNVPMQFFMS